MTGERRPIASVRLGPTIAGRPIGSFWPIVLAALGLTYLVAVVFHPILGFLFIELDVREQVLDNPYVHGLTAENVGHILTSPCVSSYYPVRTLTLALDYEIWGLNPRGYKLTGGLIHLANVLLVFWLILRLFPGRAAHDGPAQPRRMRDIGEVALAAFAAGVFAIHPVVVEPVTWVAGREELLMTLGALGCLHFHLSARSAIREGGRSGRATACFVAAALFCAFGCLSNAVGAVIPALVTAWDVLTLPKPRLGRIFRGTFALWLIGAATVAVKWLRPGVPEPALPRTISAIQPGVVLTVYWLNLTTLAWPTKLALRYPDVFPHELDIVHVALGGVAAAGTCVLLWKVRRHTRILFGLLWFCLALAPASQIVLHHLQRADRRLYLPLVGLAVAAGVALWRLRRFAKGPAAVLAAAAAGVGILLLLDTLSARQVQKWRDNVTLWEHCAAVFPEDNVFLADALQSAGQMERAAATYQKALELDPTNIRALDSLALCLTTGDAPRLDDHRLAVELAERGCRLTRWRDSRLTFTLARAHTALANTYQAAGQYRLAIDHYYKAIQTHPEYDLALFNLALLLSTCRDQALREPNTAVRLAEQGCRVADPPDAGRLSILAVAYAEAGRFEDAVAVTEKALEAARESDDRGAQRQLGDYLWLFERGLPLTGSPKRVVPEVR